MNFEKLKKELLISIRGSRSARTMSLSLNRSPNQVSRWENGAVDMSWIDFVHFARECKTPIDRNLKRQFGLSQSADHYSELIEEITWGYPRKKICELTSSSEQIVRAWLAGRRCPSFTDILRLMDGFNQNLFRFCGELTNLNQIPTFKEDYRISQIEDKIAGQYPMYMLAWIIISSDAYLSHKTHPVGWIGGLLGLSISDEKNILEALVELKMIEFKNKIYQVIGNPVSRPKLSIRSRNDIRKYWLMQSLNHFSKDQSHEDNSIISNRMMLLGPKQVEKLKAMILKFMTAAGTLDTDRSGNEIFIVSFQAWNLLPKLNSVQHKKNHKTFALAGALSQTNGISENNKQNTNTHMS